MISWFDWDILEKIFELYGRKMTRGTWMGLVPSEHRERIQLHVRGCSKGLVIRLFGGELDMVCDGFRGKGLVIWLIGGEKIDMVWA